IALLVVCSGPSPVSRRSRAPNWSSAAQPPGPGLPRAAPSVVIVTSGSSFWRSAICRSIQAPCAIHAGECGTHLYTIFVLLFDLRSRRRSAFASLRGFCKDSAVIEVKKMLKERTSTHRQLYQKHHKQPPTYAAGSEGSMRVLNATNCCTTVLFRV